MEHFEIPIDEGNVKMEGRTRDLMRGLAIAAANIIRNNTKPGVSTESATTAFCELVRFEVYTGSVTTVEVDTSALEQALNGCRTRRAVRRNDNGNAE